MPELPEVEALAALPARACGRPAVDRVDVAAISALKTFDPPPTALQGWRSPAPAGTASSSTSIVGDGLHLVVHLARAGWLHYRESLSPAPPKPGKGRSRCGSPRRRRPGFDLTEAGTQKRLAAYVVRDPTEVPGVARLGPGRARAGSRDDARRALAARTRPGQGRAHDQKVLAGIGNAYSDEILHAARMSPFAMAARSTRRAGRDPVRGDA